MLVVIVPRRRRRQNTQISEDSTKGSKATLVYGQMNEPPGARARVALTGLTIAEVRTDRDAFTEWCFSLVLCYCHAFLFSFFSAAGPALCACLVRTVGVR